MRISRLMITMLAGCVVCAGCASIVSKSTYPVRIGSNEDNATVTITQNGSVVQVLRTPGTAYLAAGNGYFTPSEYTLEFKKDGFESEVRYCRASLDPWFIGNILFGGIIGMAIIDPMTGAMWQFSNESIYAEMREMSDDVVIKNVINDLNNASESEQTAKGEN